MTNKNIGIIKGILNTQFEDEQKNIFHSELSSELDRRRRNEADN